MAFGGKKIVIGGEEVNIPSFSKGTVWFAGILVAGLILLFTMFYKVGTDEVGVIQRFGRYTRSTQPGLHLKLPFGIHNYGFLYRKNIMIVFGSKDAGKTAFILNFIRLNMEGWKRKIQLFNVDMGAEEMRGRIERFPDTTIEQWDEYVYIEERAVNFVDFIEPDWINIVDFLEVSTDFYRIGGMIKEMLDKVTGNGILVVAVQKNKDAEYGLGGQRTIERAKLVVTLDPGIIRILVGKNWQDGIESSPKGRSWSYKLVGGTKIVNIIENTR